MEIADVYLCFVCRSHHHTFVKKKTHTHKVVEADVIVHIVDVSSPSREKQESAVTGVLDEMKVSDKPRLTLWNKLDVVPEDEQEQIRVDAEERGELTVAASAKTGQGLDDFVTCLEVFMIQAATAVL